ncbi:11970_t:CDS:2 [Ambispora gerdemannii]|uniref:11970_t:CDS:1 n=1 Tax=Ambispora gerdemannii TaxID=144530 RepID=A0A9N8WNL7_9GLOM|nr:11970_t:CDS:2 [Ambispora gerdemannii]
MAVVCFSPPPHQSKVTSTHRLQTKEHNTYCRRMVSKFVATHLFRPPPTCLLLYYKTCGPFRRYICQQQELAESIAAIFIC